MLDARRRFDRIPLMTAGLHPSFTGALSEVAS
jgi:hypothetical protein